MPEKHIKMADYVQYCGGLIRKSMSFIIHSKEYTMIHRLFIGENRFSGKTEKLFSPLNLSSPHKQGQNENPHEFYRDSMYRPAGHKALIL